LIWEDPEGAYKYEPDADCQFDGKRSLHIRNLRKGAAFGSAFQKFAAVRYRGKCVRFSAFVRSDTKDEGILWADVIQPDGRSVIGGLKNSTAAVKGKQSWTELEVVFEVPLEGYVICLGASLEGGGELWVSGLHFQEAEPTGRISESVERAMDCKDQAYVAAPTNSNFEEAPV
jgi:hypothetical protein